MKISKVDHRRTAVAVKNTNVQGVIYQDPGSIRDIDTSIQNLVKKANNLYSIFNDVKLDNAFSVKEKNKVVMSYKEMIEGKTELAFNSVVNNYLLNKNNQLPIGKIVEPLNQTTAKEVCSRVVDVGLKNSLKREIKINNETYYVPTLLKELMYATCFTKGSDEVNKFGNAKIDALCNFISEDKFKLKEQKLIKKSLENQSVRVKVTNIDGKNRVVPSCALSKKNEPLFDFMKEYASLEKEQRDEKLVDVMKLIVLFVCGEDNYNQIKDEKLQAFSFDNYHIDDSQLFLSNTELFDKKESINKLPSKDKKFHKNELVAIDEAIRVQIRKELIDHYKKATSVLSDEQSKYWIAHFESALETLFKKSAKQTKDRFNCRYLCDYLWKDFFPYIASKYVDLGKGVYHFATPNLNKLSGDKEVEFGAAKNSRYLKGITSFDYERIKAKETLDRNIATSATFASTAFSRAVISDEYKNSKNEKNNELDKTDVLTYEDKQFVEANYNDDHFKKFMWYFGGQSKWNEDELNSLGNEDKLYYATRVGIANIRNGSYHYTAKTGTKTVEDNPVNKLFDMEYSKLKEVYAKKYYSNNIPNYYKKEDIYNLMKNLYSEPAFREAQVPSFNKVIVKNGDVKNKNNLEYVIESICQLNNIDALRKDQTKYDEYKSGLRYVLKEIYYYSFLQEKDLKERFLRVFDKLETKKKDEQRAHDDFKKRVNEVCEDNSVGFGEICQYIMIDYGMQNNQKAITSTKKTKSLETKGIKKIYQHFPLLLHQAVREMFIEYLKEDKYGMFAFLAKPDKVYANTNQTPEIFANGAPEPKTFASLKEEISNNSSLLDWYITSKFLTAKQLNLLVGDFRNYIQYVSDVNERASNLGNDSDSATQGIIGKYLKIINVLEFSLIFAGQISDNILDYFKDKNDYAKYLSKFVELSGNNFEALRRFDISNIYSDVEHGILNKNVAYSMMFGNTQILEKCASKITRQRDINRYRELEESLQPVFEEGGCYYTLDQIDLREFQNLKNRIELYDLSTFTDVINDFMSQLVSWAYMRERDMMYFQLGVHYLRLFFSDLDLKEEYHVLKGDNINISDGAILYSIIAMYTHELSNYKVEDGKALKANKQGTTGASTAAFCYEYCKESGEYPSTYFTCMELFEDITQHDSLATLRNNIAHMHYMVKQDNSLMELYSDMYNRFFIYDRKLQKSVSFVFKNIMMRYHIEAFTEMKHKGEEVDKFSMVIKPDTVTQKGNAVYGLVSNDFTYKDLEEPKKNRKTGEYLVDNEGYYLTQHRKTFNVPALSRVFINQVRRLLEYKD